MPFPYQKIFMLTAVAKEPDAAKSERETVSECKLEIIEKTLDKFPGVKISVTYMPSMKSGQYDFFVAVDEKEKMPWT